jgi:nitroreductase
VNTPPAGVLTGDEIAILLSAAGAAPSMHNTQPWRFDVTGAVVDVLLDADRALPAEDPTGRLVRIGLGAAAFNLRVAAAMLGHETTVVTDPDPARADIVARVFLGSRGTGGDLGALYAEVHRRHTYRGPMTHLPVDDRLRAVLHEAARSEGAALIWLDAGRVQQVLGLVVESEVLDHADEARRAELARWIGGEHRDDGVPSRALGPRPDAFPVAYRDLGADVDGEQREPASFEAEPQVAVLVTSTDGPEEWLQAGMALQRVLLLASAHDVSASFVNQPLEHPEQRAYVRTIAGAGQPQQIIRLGYPSGPGVHTPRRSWRELRRS